MKLEQKYFNTIEMMNNNPLSNDITINSDSSIESSKDNNNIDDGI